jgi:hypothetical protein
MERVTAYAVVFSQGEDLNDFHEEVHDLIKKGWQPLGGIAMVRDQADRLRFAQAMVSTK